MIFPLKMVIFQFAMFTGHQKSPDSYDFAIRAFLPFLPLRLKRLEIAGMAQRTQRFSGWEAQGATNERNPRFLGM